MSRITLPDGTMSAHLARAASEEAVGSVLIVPSIFGLDEGGRQVADQLAAMGCHALLPDIFWRVAPGPLGFSDLELARERAAAVDPRLLLRDLVAALRLLREECPGPVVVLGICFGGRFALLLASRGGVDAAVTWHGGGLAQLVNLAPQIRCPLSLHFGEQDEQIPLSEVARLRNTFGRQPQVRIHLHPAVGHGFAHPGHPAFSRIAANAALADVVRMVRQLQEAPPPPLPPPSSGA